MKTDMYRPLHEVDPDIAAAIDNETRRQHEGLELIASENFVSEAVLEAHRGRGLSKWLMECIVSHPALQGLRRWTLATRDAHGLYGKFGFTPLAAPARWMERHNSAVYRSASDAPPSGEL